MRPILMVATFVLAATTQLAAQKPLRIGIHSVGMTYTEVTDATKSFPNHYHQYD